VRLIYAPQRLEEGIDALAGEPVFYAILDRAGEPRFRRRRNGFPTLLHIILEQQVSIDAAAAMHRRLSGLCHPLAPEPFLALDDATLRTCGFSRQKMDYGRRLAQAVASGAFDFDGLAAAADGDALAAPRRNGRRSSMPQTIDPKRQIRSVCVYCGSAGAVDQRYRAAAAELGHSFAAAGITMVFGGGHIGLMGIAADAALAGGGRVTG